jgi:hypothetical protein
MSNLVAKLAEHVAILADNAVFQAVPNKLKLEKNPNAAPEFYARIAFPAAAQDDLWNVIAEKATAAFGNSNGIKHGIKVNSGQTKPIAGIAGTDIIVRASTQFAPDLYDADGTQLDRGNPVHVKIIKEKFFPGATVRPVLSPYDWTHPTQGRGVSFNLAGLMVAPTENVKRLAIGGVDTANAFAKFAKPGAGGSQQSSVQPTDNAAAAAPANNGNPFAQGNPNAAAAGGNPFA